MRKTISLNQGWDFQKQGETVRWICRTAGMLWMGRRVRITTAVNAFIRGRCRKLQGSLTWKSDAANSVALCVGEWQTGRHA